MWRYAFCIALTTAGAPFAAAQHVPGRDLLDFPVGSVAEAAPLAVLAGLGIWNPAAGTLDSTERWQIAAATMDGPSIQGVTAQLISTAIAVSGAGTISVSWLGARVADLVRTDGDPQSVGPDIRYSTSLLTVGVSRRVTPLFTAGLALRHHRGTLDDIRASTTAADFGLIVTPRIRGDPRFAVSTFLLSPGSMTDNAARISGAADLRLWSADSVYSSEVRAGYSFSNSSGLSREHYFFSSIQIRSLSLNGGLLRTESYGSATVRARLGVAIRTRSVTVALTREENAAGVAPAYHASVGTIFHR